MPDVLSHPKIKGAKFFYVLLFVFSALAFYLIKDFWREILFALTTAFILHPYYLFLQRKYKLGPRTANLIVIFTSVIFLFIPVFFASYLVLKDALAFREAIGNNFNLSDINLDLILVQINEVLASIPFVDYQISLAEFNAGLNNTVTFMTNYFVKLISGIAGSAANIFLSLLIFVTVLFFLYPQLDKFFKYIRDLSPLDNGIDEYFLSKAKSMTLDMLKGTVAVGFAQSLVGALIFMIFGVPYVLTLTVLMIIFSMIPIIGTTIVTIPVGLILILTGNIFAGLVIIAVQLIIIGNIDNVLRPMLVSEESKLHPTLVILGVIGGLRVMGMLGVIYGPVIMILFVTAVEIYKKYYRYK